MEQNRAYAYLRIVGFPCSVEELTQRIGLSPSEAWSAGEESALSKQPRKANAWHLRSRLAESESLERHVVDVLDQVRGRESIMLGVAKDYGAILECVGYFHEYYPGFSLDAPTVRRLAECGLALDLDFYHYFTERDQDTETQRSEQG